MLTMEDVFWIFERNILYYDNTCTDLAKCPNNFKNTCFCDKTSSIILPETICDRDCGCCNMNVKMYISPGEECSICLEKIFTRKNAYLSYCGHSFHKTCIFKAFEEKWKTKYCSQFKCPLCRRNLNPINIGERYDNTSNKLDELENFWIMGEKLQMPQYCPNNYDHAKGMNSDCDACKKYRIYG